MLDNAGGMLTVVVAFVHIKPLTDSVPYKASQDMCRGYVPPIPRPRINRMLSRVCSRSLGVTASNLDILPGIHGSSQSMANYRGRMVGVVSGVVLIHVPISLFLKSTNSKSNPFASTTCPGLKASVYTF